MSSITGDLTEGHISARWPSYLDAPLRSNGTRATLVLALTAGVAFDIGIRSGIDGVGGALAVVVAASVVLASRRVRNPQAIALIAVAPLFGMWLAIRTSPWLLPFDILASAALLLLGSSLAGGGSLFDVGVPHAVARAFQAVVQGVLVPPFLVRTNGEAKGRHIARGVLIAIPLMVVLAALFASADAVFARAVDINISTAVLHTVAIVVGTLGAGWLLRLASLRHVEVPEATAPTLAPTEWTIVLAGIDLVLAGFAAAQIVALTSGGRHVLHTAGLTYAEYARTGFFQLVAAVAVTGLSLLALHATSGGARRFRVLAIGAIALTFVVVVSAYHRLALYEHVFGLTMLRLYVQVAIVGAGVLLLALVAYIGGAFPSRAWFAPVAGIVVLTTLFGLNVLNPEAFVARYNLTHRSAHFDESYLTNLSSDAVPALAPRKAICQETRTGPRGWAAFNVSRYRAQSLRKENCR